MNCAKNALPRAVVLYMGCGRCGAVLIAICIFVLWFDETKSVLTTKRYDRTQTTLLFFIGRTAVLLPCCVCTTLLWSQCFGLITNSSYFSLSKRRMCKILFNAENQIYLGLIFSSSTILSSNMNMYVCKTVSQIIHFIISNFCLHSKK